MRVGGVLDRRLQRGETNPKSGEPSRCPGKRHQHLRKLPRHQGLDTPGAAQECRSPHGFASQKRAASDDCAVPGKKAAILVTYIVPKDSDLVHAATDATKSHADAIKDLQKHTNDNDNNSKSYLLGAAHAHHQAALMKGSAVSQDVSETERQVAGCCTAHLVCLPLLTKLLMWSTCPSPNVPATRYTSKCILLSLHPVIPILLLVAKALCSVRLWR